MADSGSEAVLAASKSKRKRPIAPELERERAKVNKFLTKVKIQVNTLGTKYMLRGYFPPHPSRSGTNIEKRRSLPIGISVSEQGLKSAIAIAKEVDGQLLNNSFNWDSWLPEKQRAPSTVKDWVAKLTQCHWDVVPQNPDTKIAWKKNYQDFFRRLPQDKVLTYELLEKAIKESSHPGSRARKGWCIACGKLADFACLDGKMLRKLSTYSSLRSVNPRTLPSDEAIGEALSKIKNSGWRTVYILIAVYGLRPHEFFRCEFDQLNDDLPVLVVQDDSKTKYHRALACYADCWDDDFRLRTEDIIFPNVQNIQTASKTHLGSKVSQEFRELGLNKIVGPPYNLRHSWARRTYEEEWHPELAARAMGHSLYLHEKVYHQFMNQSSDMKLYKKVYKDKKE